MLMNSIEYWAMNNPIRAFVQRHYEAPRLRRLFNGKADNVLEIGCGQGTGATIIYDLFSPQRYVGIDLDPRMIRRARRRAGTLPNASFIEGDVSSLDTRSFIMYPTGRPRWASLLHDVQKARVCK